MVSENIIALKRILKIAQQAGADEQDLAKAGGWPLYWCYEVMKRHQLERFADIGRRVSSGRENEDRSLRWELYSQILFCACRLLLDGAKPRGLAGKIKKELNADISVRQINRILNEWMPIVLSK